MPNPHGGFVKVDQAQDVFVEVKSLVQQTGEYGLFVSEVSDGFTVFFDGNADTVFTGTSVQSRPSGGLGNDFLNVGAGFDAFGEQGNDFINGNGGSNRLSGGLGDDLVFAGLGDDFVWGDAGDDFLEGNAGNDIVFGGSGVDELFGLQDSDKLIGGEGADVLNGGDGADTVDYSAVPQRRECRYWPQQGPERRRWWRHLRFDRERDRLEAGRHPRAETQGRML